MSSANALRGMMLVGCLPLLLVGGCDLAAVGGDEEMVDDGGRQSFGVPGSYIGQFWTTYYYLVDQSSYPGSGYPIYNKSCQVLVSSTKAFYNAAKMEGSARLDDGRVINYAGGCTCGGASRTCFALLDASKPWGEGASNNALVPLRSIGVDPNRIALGTPVYLKEWEGRYIPDIDGIGGFVHDGCFRADDTGGAVKDNHYDFFAGTSAMWKALEHFQGTKTYVAVYHGGGKCAYVLGLGPGGGGSNGNGGGGGGSGGSGNDHCFYAGQMGTCQSTSLGCNGSFHSGLCPGPNDIQCCVPSSGPGGDTCQGRCGLYDPVASCQCDTACSLPENDDCCPDLQQECSNVAPPPGNGGEYGTCSHDGEAGTCQSTSLGCSGSFHSGLCPGPADIQCCVPSGGGGGGTCQGRCGSYDPAESCQCDAGCALPENDDCCPDLQQECSNVAPPGNSGNYGNCSYAGEAGTCQSTSLGCSGSFHSGLCPGPADIQCCVPSGGGAGGTCQGRCGSYDPAESCQCDTGCALPENDDCCPDLPLFCPI